MEASDREVRVLIREASDILGLKEGTVRNMAEDGRLPHFDGKPRSAPRRLVMAARVIPIAHVHDVSRRWFKVPQPMIYEAISLRVVPPPSEGRFLSRDDLEAIQTWHDARSANVSVQAAPDFRDDIADKHMMMLPAYARPWFQRQLERRRLARTSSSSR